MIRHVTFGYLIHELLFIAISWCSNLFGLGVGVRHYTWFWACNCELWSYSWSLIGPCSDKFGLVFSLISADFRSPDCQRMPIAQDRSTAAHHIGYAWAYKIITGKEKLKIGDFFEFSDTGYNLRGHCYKLDLRDAVICRSDATSLVNVWWARGNSYRTTSSKHRHSQRF